MTDIEGPDDCCVEVHQVVFHDYQEFDHNDEVHYNLATYVVHFRVKGQLFTVPLQISQRNGDFEDPWILKAWLDPALEFFTSDSPKREHRTELAEAILSKALEMIQ